MIARGICSLLICLLASPALAGEEKPIVAVFPIEAKRVKIRRKTLEVLNVFLPARLAASGAFQVVPRRELADRMRQQKKASYKLCYDQKCQIELGRELAAQKILSTQIMKIGKKCVMTSSLYDLKKAATERGAPFEGKCSEEGLMIAVKNVGPVRRGEQGRARGAQVPLRGPGQPGNPALRRPGQRGPLLAPGA